MRAKAAKNIQILFSLVAFLIASLACNRSVSKPPNTPPPEITYLPTQTVQRFLPRL